MASNLDSSFSDDPPTFTATKTLNANGTVNYAIVWSARFTCGDALIPNCKFCVYGKLWILTYDDFTE